MKLCVHEYVCMEVHAHACIGGYGHIAAHRSNHGIPEIPVSDFGVVASRHDQVLVLTCSVHIPDRRAMCSLDL